MMKSYAARIAQGLALLLVGITMWGASAEMSPALAHSVLVSSAPKIDAVVAPGPRDLTLTFDSRVDAHRSRIFMTYPDGVRHALTPEIGKTKGTLVVHVEDLPVGQIYLNYEVLSVDGHIARGVVKFTVGAP